ncbi:glutamyl-tRNA reductase [Clostridium intestinale]|uniref:Glutamyl-tRNA reductase n=1 Tax=Clostridium intestinale TaxID=36845 RepID=A0A7D6VQW0_9CLOT|nr:glutamyl-tRNA reductase [Clostridium intestinale]QLY79849.1 glutamyl-tRNA reductase [Clostridium intestinale]
MIQLIGILKGTSVDIREKFVIRDKYILDKIINIKEFCNEVLIINTCNRTEIYFDSEDSSHGILYKIFETLEWDKELREYIFHIKEEKVVKHIMELACGLHSKILGEDQILSQIKEAYDNSLNVKGLHGNLQRLFQEAITCGKEFRNEAKLYEIPVSYPSIAVNKAIKEGIRDFMVIGYGDMGNLAVKYILTHNIDSLYIVVRNKGSVKNIDDSRIKVITFEEKNEILRDVKCIIGCTSAPHTVLKNRELPKGERYLIFDLAMPRDIEESIALRDDAEVYDIDSIALIDEENKKLRKEKMNKNRFIIDKYIESFETWKDIRKITPYIKKMKENANKIAEERIETFNNKLSSKDPKRLADNLIKSTSHYYVNRAIEVLKEERLKGSDEECLRIIEKIFMS